ncbi:hypothetical protein [Synechococcus sp. BSA11S]|uniref:hypothetical protein n=1 Tax=Synechococcus sp. BSA11S TaxID=2599077 RepID=UPI00162738AF|nr:hypothetical protein [Synechococcus sp. BSA11S]
MPCLRPLGHACSAVAPLRGLSLVQAITARDPVSGSAYVVALGLMGVMPWLLTRCRGA